MLHSKHYYSDPWLHIRIQTHACITFSRTISNNTTTTKFSISSFFNIHRHHTLKHPLTLAYSFFPSLFCCSVAFSGSWPMCLLSKGEPNTVEWVSELPWQRNLTAGCNGNVIEREEQTFTYWVGLHSLRLAAGQVVFTYSTVDGSSSVLSMIRLEAGRATDPCLVTVGLMYWQIMHSLPGWGLIES